MFTRVRELFGQGLALTKKTDKTTDDNDYKFYAAATRRMNGNDFKIHRREYMPSQVTKNRPIDTELKVARLLFFFSAFILGSKIYFTYTTTFNKWSAKALSLLYEVWQYLLHLQWLLVPLLIGLLTTYITWIVVYYDSKIPGVQPPSPFSPTNNSVRRWHSCYVAAIASGVIVFLILLLL